MENRLLYMLQFMLTQVWQFFQLPFPGTNVSIGALCIFPVVVSITIAFFRSLFGLGGFASVGEHIRLTSSTAKVDRLNAKQTEREARKYVK